VRRAYDQRSRFAFVRAGTDQALSTGTNVLGTIGVARGANPEEFGGFALFLLVYSFCVGLVNAAVSEPSLVSRRDDVLERGRLIRHSGFVGVGIGVLATALIVGVTSGRAQVFAVTPMALLPLLAAHEALRVTSFGNGHFRLALVADGVWFALAAAVLGVSIILPAAIGPLGVAVLWAMSAGVALIAGARGAGVGWREIYRPAKGDRRRTPSVVRKAFVIDHVTMYTATYAAPYSAAVVGGIGVLGALRGAQVLFGPPQLLIAGARLVILPMFAHGTDVSRCRNVAIKLAIALTVAVGVWAVMLRLIPDSMGTELLGNNWAASMEFLVVLAAAVAGRAAASVPAAALRGLGETKGVLVARAADAPATVLGATIGAFVAGPIGAVGGWAAANGFGAIVWWLVLLKATQSSGWIRQGYGREG
jgi:hypothetical protein